MLMSRAMLCDTRDMKVGSSMYDSPKKCAVSSVQPKFGVPRKLGIKLRADELSGKLLTETSLMQRAPGSSLREYGDGLRQVLSGKVRPKLCGGPLSTCVVNVSASKFVPTDRECHC